MLSFVVISSAVIDCH